MNNSLLLLLAAVLVGCSESPPAGDALQSAPVPAPSQGDPTMTASNSAQPSKTKQQWYQQIKQQVGSAAADDVSQCRLAPLGHKPCGGPASYLVYSVRDLDEPALLAAIAQYNALDQAQQRASGLVSDCAIVPEPVVTLQNGVCVAMPAHLSANHLTE